MRIWDLAGDRRLDTPLRRRPAAGHRRPVAQGRGAEPGRPHARRHPGATARSTWSTRARCGRARSAARPAPGRRSASTSAPTAALLAVTGEGARVTLWDARTLARAGELKGLNGFSQEVAFSPDGRRSRPAMATAPRQRRVLVWDVRSGEPTAVEFDAPGASLAFSPDGRLLAANGYESPTRGARRAHGPVVARLRPATPCAPSPSAPTGELLAVGRYGRHGAARVDAHLEARGPRARRPRGAPDRARVLSPTGACSRPAAPTARCACGTSTRSGAIGSPLEIEPEAYVSARFSRDGSHLFAVPHDGARRALGRAPRVLETPRVPGRRPRAHRARVARRAPGPAAAARLPSALVQPAASRQRSCVGAPVRASTRCRDGRGRAVRARRRRRYRLCEYEQPARAGACIERGSVPKLSTSSRTAAEL